MGDSNTLFNGIKFWLSQRIPLRSKFVDDIKKHGGIVVPVERLADMLVVDHLRKDNHLPNSYSYRFIELSVRNGALEDKDNHCVHTEAPPIRPVGDPLQGVKTTRTPFTRADDIFLKDWISKTRHPLQGDRAFKELELVNNRHTWQSWRSRWVKRLQHITPVIRPEPVVQDPMVSTAPPARTAVMHVTPKQHVETSKTQHENTAINKTPLSARHSKTPSRSSISMTKTPALDSRASELYPSPSSKTPSPRPLAEERSQPRLEQPPRHSSISKASPVQIRNILARLAGDAEQALKRAPDLKSYPEKEPGNGIETSSSEPLLNVGSGIPSKREVDSNRQISSRLKPRPSAMSVGHGKDSKLTSTSGSSKDINNLHLKADSLTSVEARTVLPGTLANPHADREPSSEPVKSMGSSVSKAAKSPRQTSEHNLDWSQNNSIPELLERERMAVDIWTELLQRSGATGTHLSEETAFLIANVKIICALDESSFQTVWSIWWQSCPEKTEEEWVQHFNQFCKPFHAAYIGEFLVLYQRRYGNSSHETNARTNGEDVVYPKLRTESPELGDRTDGRSADNKKERTVQRYQAEGSPELGNKTRGLPKIVDPAEPKTPTLRHYVIESSPSAASPLKRTRSSSEVPESPRTSCDDDITSTKRYRASVHDKGNIASTSKLNGLRSPLALKTTVEESTDEEVGGKLLYPKMGKGDNSSSPDTPGNLKVQASVDRQLWLEEEDADQPAHIPTDRQKIPADRSPRANNILKGVNKDKHHPLKGRTLEANEVVEEPMLFVSDGSQPPVTTPKTPSISELSEQFSDPHHSGPFYEASDIGIQGDFEDLTSQVAGLIEAPTISYPDILPSIEEKGKQTAKTDKQSYNTENESESEEKQEGISEWIKRKLRKGHSEEILTLVLNASMMDTNLARKALLYHQKFNRLPNTKPGIWTEDDDNMLLMHSRKGKRALIEKHGREALDKRREYLEKLKLTLW